MKKIYFSMMAIAIAAFTFTACEDVPEPYNNPYDQLNNNTGGETSAIYSSEALNTGWSLQSVTADQPWITGSSYAQATGYQKWDGASDKSNRAVEGWLVSPAISTVGHENVKLSFDNTIRYTNNVSGWADNHKIYASTSFDGTNASTATWTELNFTPVASTYSDWTLYSSGEIQLPAEFVGKETVYIAFYFKAPASSSTTWEVKNFKMEDGIAGENNGGGEGDNGDSNSSTLESPYDVPTAIAKATATGAYVKGYIVGAASGMSLVEGASFSATTDVVTNVIIAASADETDVTKCMPIQLPNGSDVRTKLTLKDNAGNYKKEVTLYGNITSYFKTIGLKEVTFAVLDGNEIGTNPNGGGNSGDSGDGNAVYSVNFKANGQGDWTIDNKTLPTGVTNIWTYNNKYGMVASAFVSNTKNDSESWLISPAIDLSTATSATLKIHHAINKFSSVDIAKTQVAVLISDDGTNWTELALSNWPTTLSWTFFDSTIDISAYKGKNNVKLALKYLSTTESTGTWEVETITIE